jgi:2-methylisocitrate lyase-like PEP mutase family enzyme
MDQDTGKAAAFLALHRRDRPLLLANAWDAGSARLLASLGFEALATTSSGHAASLGRLDYSVTREEAIAHARELAAATALPLSADLEDCFAPDAAAVADTVRAARDTGLAGCSIEDWSAAERRLYGLAEASERVAAAAEEAHSGGLGLVLTARAENHLRGNPDLGDTITRLQAFERAGADVLYAPGLQSAEEIGEVVAAVSVPVNVLARPGLPTVTELAELGVARVSVGGAFAFAALAAAAAAGEELLQRGTYGFTESAAAGISAARSAFSA